MQTAFAPSRSSHYRSPLATISGSLFERMCFGMSWVSIGSADTLIASLVRIRHAAWIARH